jgi:glucose/arabinose dehydrogenase
MLTFKSNVSSAIHRNWRIIPVIGLLLAACGSPVQAATPTLIEVPAMATVALAVPATPVVEQKPSAVPTIPNAEKVPDGSQYRWMLKYSGFVKPVELLSPPGEQEKVLVVEQGGIIKKIENGVVTKDLYLDIRDRVGTRADEQGLLGMAFHPLYESNRYFYVNYSDFNGNTVIARFTASADGQTVDPQTELRLLQVDQPYENHNGGGLAFGPDGYLYIGLGDGGSAGDPQNNAQNLDTLLGKMLRVDINLPQGYAIPADNPFAKGGGKAEIWAYGLRNPWRFSFDPATGDLWIGDVGQKLWEEVDFLLAGSFGGVNFGWNIMEGSHPYQSGSSNPGNLQNPIFEYDHKTGCSITGGFVYRGQILPEWQGVYVFGDYCQGTIFGLIRTPSEIEVKQVGKINGTISSFGVDGNGELYLMDHKNGGIYRLEPR